MTVPSARTVDPGAEMISRAASDPAVLAPIWAHYRWVAPIYPLFEPLLGPPPGARDRDVARLGLGPGDTVLWVGAGTGRNLRRLVGAVGREVLSPHPRHRARATAQPHRSRRYGRSMRPFAGPGGRSLAHAPEVPRRGPAPQPPLPKTVLFDIDDTLYDHTYAARRAMGALRAADPRFRRFTLDRLHALSEQILSDVHRELVLPGRISVEAGRVLRVRRLAERLGVRLDRRAAQRLTRLRSTAYARSQRSVPGSRELLRSLRRLGVGVGVVSNHLVSAQRAKLRAVGLDGLIDSWTISDEAGFAKPDPRIFRIALRRSRCAGREAVMIGDSWEWDVVGARAAGITPVWFARDDRPAPPGDPIAVLRSFRPVSSAVSAIAAARGSPTD